MSQLPLHVSLYDLLVAPAIRDYDVLIPMFFFWFLVEIIGGFFMKMISPSYRKLSATQQRDFNTRICAIVNGLISLNTAYAFVRGGMKGGVEAMYEEIPDYRFYRISIVTYFMWDVVVCFLYNWDLAWKVHGFFSFAGTYILMFPFADTFGTYFTGMFELSNAFIHIAEMLRTLDSTKDEKKREFAGIITISEYVFGLLFAIIRVIGGSYVMYYWFLEVDLMTSTNQYHHLIGVYGVCVVIVTIMALQYYWFYKIIAAVFGGVRDGSGDMAADKPEGSSPTSPAETEKKSKKVASPKRKQAAKED